MVTFKEAIKLGFKNSFNFSGRATRAEYWWWCFARLLFFIPLAYIAVKLMILWTDIGWLVYLPIGFYILIYLTSLIPTFSLIIRRLHDSGHSGWILLWTIIASISSVPILEFILSEHLTHSLWIDGIYLICSIPMLCMLAASSVSDNRYGPNPHAEEHSETKK